MREAETADLSQSADTATAIRQQEYIGALRTAYDALDLPGKSEAFRVAWHVRGTQSTSHNELASLEKAAIAAFQKALPILQKLREAGVQMPEPQNPVLAAVGPGLLFDTWLAQQTTA